MATRMTTLLYGENPGCDVAPGNRADTADVPFPAPAPPFPATPRPDPWIAPAGPRDVALPTMMFGVAAVAAVFTGLAVVGVALAWSQSMTTLAEVALIVAGGFLLAVGIGYVVSASSRERQLLQPSHA